MGQRIVIELAVDDRGTAAVKRFSDGVEREIGAGAKRASDAAGREFSKMASEFGASIDRMQKTAVTLGGILSGVGIAAMAKRGAEMGTEYVRSMGELKAMTGATGKVLADLDRKAIELGRDTVFSASDAAHAMSVLGKSGIAAGKILEAIPAVLDLAAASGQGMEESANVAVNIMHGMGIAAKDFGHASDVMAKATTSAHQSITELGYSFMYVGPVARAAGVSFEEVTSAITVLRQAGVEASIAGTGLRRMLSVMLGNLEPGEKGLAELGVRLVDNKGKFVGLSGAIEQLNKEFDRLGIGGLQRAHKLMEYFGERGGPTVIALMQRGAKEIAAFTEKFQNATGAAKEMAQIRLDNFWGDMILLKSSIEYVAIAIFQKLQPGLRETAKDLVTLTNQFADFVRGSSFVDGLVRGFHVLELAVGALVARQLWQWSASAATAMGGLNTALVLTTNTAMLGAAKMDGLALGMNAATLRVGGLVAGVGILSYELTRMVMELTGADSAVQSFLEDVANGKANARAKIAGEAMGSTLSSAIRRTLGDIPGALMTDADVKRFAELGKQLEGAIDLSGRDETGNILAGELEAAQAEYDKLAEKARGLTGENLKLYQTAVSLRRTYPALWEEAASGFGLMADRVDYVNAKLRLQAEAAAAKAERDQKAIASARLLTEEEKKLYDQAKRNELRLAMSTENWSLGTLREALTEMKLAFDVSGDLGQTGETFAKVHEKELASMARGMRLLGTDVEHLGAQYRALGPIISLAFQQAGPGDKQKELIASLERSIATLRGGKGIDVPVNIEVPPSMIAKTQADLREMWKAWTSPEINGTAGGFAMIPEVADKLRVLRAASDTAKAGLDPMFLGLIRYLTDVEHKKESLDDVKQALEQDSRAFRETADSMARFGLITAETGALLSGDLVSSLTTATAMGFTQLQWAIANKQALYDLKDAYAAVGQEVPAALQGVMDQLGNATLMDSYLEKIRQIRDTWRSALGDISDNMGDAVGRWLVYQESFGDGVKGVVKQFAAQWISALVSLAARWVATHILMAAVSKTTLASSASAAIGAGLAQVAVNSFASAAAIPLYGWMIAPGVAAANLAAATAMASGALTFGASSGSVAADSAGFTSGVDDAAMAQGGIAVQPTRALVGEAGAEAVVPLQGENARRVAKAMGLDQRGTGTTVVEVHQHFHGDNWQQDGVATTLLRTVYDGIAEAIRAGHLQPLPTGRV